MFSNLRAGNQVYILHKSQADLAIEVGTVETTSVPQNTYGIYSGMMPFPIDINVRVGTQVIPYRGLPPNMETAEVKGQNSGDALLLATNKVAINNEVEKLKQASISALNMMDFHRRRIASCDAIHSQVNPEEAIKAQQQAEMQEMKQQMTAMQQQLLEQSEINKQLLAQLKGERASESPSYVKPTKKDNKYDGNKNSSE